MKIILRDDVSGLGSKGDQLDVAAGYFRNYLCPKGLAIKASKGIERQAEAMRSAAARRNAADRAQAERVATTLVPMVITVAAKASEAGRLFGSVGAADIVAAVEQQARIVIDRRKLSLESPLKELGSAMAMCKLHAEVEFPITIEVVNL